MAVASSSRPVAHFDAVSALALRRLSGTLASVRPCSCCWQQQQQQQRPTASQQLQLQQPSSITRLQPSPQTRGAGLISRRQRVISGAGAAGGLGGHGGGRGEPVRCPTSCIIITIIIISSSSSDSLECSPQVSTRRLQVDTPAKKALLGVALAYIGLVVVLPFVNVFIQVS